MSLIKQSKGLLCFLYTLLYCIVLCIVVSLPPGIYPLAVNINNKNNNLPENEIAGRHEAAVLW
jgi:hypothetical protein